MAGGQKSWSNVSPSDISVGRWPFRFCDIKKVDTCEEVLGIEVLDKILSHEDVRDSVRSWNSRQIKQCRQRFDVFGQSDLHSLGRNLFQMLLLKHFDGRLLAHQRLPLRPFEIYVAPCKYVKYKPQVDIFLDDPTHDSSVCLNIIEMCSKPDLEDYIHQTMFCTLSGGRSTAHCFVIKVAPKGSFQIYVGKVEWPVEMHQMMTVCGSNVTRELGFNHQKHCQPIIAKYAHLGDISPSDDDCPTVPLFLNVVDILSASGGSSFLPITDDMKEIIDTRKSTHKHIPQCINDDINVCNGKFDQC